MNHLKSAPIRPHPLSPAVGLLLAAATAANAQTWPSVQGVCGDADLSGLAARVYVADPGKDRDGCGSTFADPCATIAVGIARCAGRDRCGVLVGYGVYRLSAPIALADGVGVYGGCLPPNQADPRYTSVILAPPQPPDRPDQAPSVRVIAITARGIKQPTLLYGFQVFGSDWRIDQPNVMQASPATTAMSVYASPGLVLDQVQLIGAQGGNGIAGRSADGSGCGGQCGGADASQCGSGGQASPDVWGRMTWSVWQPSRGTDGAAAPDCPDHGARGGQQGGPSFALLLWDSSIVARRLTVCGGRGGPGGGGGNGGTGPGGWGRRGQRRPRSWRGAGGR